MFTGHISEIGIVEHVGDDRFLIRVAKAAGQSSVYVNGVALTVHTAGDDPQVLGGRGLRRDPASDDLRPDRAGQAGERGDPGRRR